MNNEKKPLRGLLVSILESKDLGNCSNGGVSSRCKSAVIVGEGIPELFESSSRLPAVRIVKRDLPGGEYIHAEPAEEKKSGYIGWMMGGCFVYSSDSRFREISPYPIPLHDRQESQELYDSLSR